MDDIVIKTITGVCAVLTVLVFLATIEQKTKIMDFNNQCLADGHKEYECYAMLHGGKK